MDSICHVLAVFVGPEWDHHCRSDELPVLRRSDDAIYYDHNTSDQLAVASGLLRLGATRNEGTFFLPAQSFLY